MALPEAIHYDRWSTGTTSPISSLSTSTSIPVSLIFRAAGKEMVAIGAKGTGVAASECLSKAYIETAKRQ